jgi:hypothetical protein
MHAHLATWKVTLRDRVNWQPHHAPRRMLPVETFDGPAAAWQALSNRILGRIGAGAIVVSSTSGPPAWAHEVSDGISDAPSILVTFPKVRASHGASFREQARIWQCDCGDAATRTAAAAGD